MLWREAIQAVHSCIIRNDIVPNLPRNVSLQGPIESLKLRNCYVYVAGT